MDYKIPNRDAVDYPLSDRRMVLIPSRNHERLFAAMEEVASWVRQLCQGFGITDAPRNVPIMGGENQTEESPVYENLLGVKYENSAESNYQDMVDWSMPGGEGLP